MNWRLNVGWTYPNARTQEEWDMIDNIERLRAALETHASPTIDRGDSHGARGQRGWIVYESSLPSIAEALAAVPDRAAIIEECANVAEQEIGGYLCPYGRDKPGDPTWGHVDTDKCPVCGKDSEGATRACHDNAQARIAARIRALAAVPSAPPSIIRCEHCDNGIETAWEYCAWCGQFLKGDVEVEERFVSRKGDSAETAYRDGVRAAVNAYEQGMTASEIRARVAAPPSIPQREVDEIETAAFLRGQASGKKYAGMWQTQCATYEAERDKLLEALRADKEAAPPSIPEREKVVEGRFAESNYRADLWWESLSEDERKAARAAAIAALEGK